MRALRFARRHPFDCSLTTRFKAVHVLDFLQPRPGEALLDVGCGLGYFLNELARSRGLVGYGLDFSHKSLALARGLCSARLCQGDAQALPFRDSAFDRIICTDVLEHVADDRAAVRELIRVARPGARIALVTPGVRGALAWTRWRRLFHDEEGTPEFDQRPGYTPEGFCRLLEEEGVRLRQLRQTLIFLGEFFLQLTKWYLARKKVRYQTQGDLLELTDTWAYRLYRRWIFPIFWGVGRAEEALLGRWAPGHSLVALGVVDKPAVARPREVAAVELSR